MSLDEVLNALTADQRTRVEQRAEEIRAEINLREMRRLRKLTQARLSKKLKIGQEGVSRIEQRTDLYLSTLRSYVEGVGGELVLMVRFPDRPPVVLSGLGEEEGKKKPKKKSAGAARKKNGTKRAA